AAVHAVARSILAETEPVAAEGSHLSHSSHYERDLALVTATAFFLVGKFSRVAFLIWYAIALPMFRSSFLLQIAYQMLNFFVYLPLLFVRSPPAINTLAVIGLATDYLLRYFVGIPIVVIDKVMKKYQKYGKREDLEKASEGVDPTVNVCAYEKSCEKMAPYIPATNIEHFIERTAAFVVIVLGELVLSVVYHATSAQVGFKSHTFVHAMRQHWFTSITFTNLHFPLCAALILVSAATSRMTQHVEEVTPAIRWYFSGGLGVALVCMALIGATHRGLDPTGTSRIGRTTQLAFRIAVGAIIICLPLAKSLSPLNMLGTSAGLTGFLVVEETYGKLRRGEPIAKPSGAEQDVIDAARAHAKVEGEHATRIESNGAISVDSVDTEERNIKAKTQ
ncbi:hypothetical protein FRC07_008752, partial [Ceratobasidium sp. 392]